MLGGRHKAREILFRVLFEVDLSAEDPREVLENTLGRFRLTEEGRDHAIKVGLGYAARREEVDRLLREQLRNWTLERVSGVTRALLRLATAELLEAADVPTEVVLDEAILLAKRYGEEDAAPFINGVLDPIARVVRPRDAGAPPGSTSTEGPA